MADLTELRVAVVGLADKIASGTLQGPRRPDQEARYLEAFRVAHRHLAQTVFGDQTTGREKETADKVDALWPKK